MTTKVSTPDKILAAAREQFNTMGYAATTLSEIARSIGISQGNLTYHFPTKRDLLERLQREAREKAAQQRKLVGAGEIEDDYVAHVMLSMNLIWSNGFLLRDRSQFGFELDGPESEFDAFFSELRTLIRRIEAAGMFRKDAVPDLELLTGSIWMVGRYWMDFMRESQNKQQVTWSDQELGIRHHFAVLLPCLTAPAKRKFEAALERAERPE